MNRWYRFLVFCTLVLVTQMAWSAEINGKGLVSDTELAPGMTASQDILWKEVGRFSAQATQASKKATPQRTQTRKYRRDELNVKALEAK